MRRLGHPERCLGSKFPPAGESLRGTQWALDRAASLLLVLDRRRDELEAQPILNGVTPFSPVYTGIWYQAIWSVEAERAKVVDEIDELQARLAEWQPTPPYLGPTPIHRVALWKCRAGTAVPLCYSEAAHRPIGDPIMIPTMAGVDCPECHHAAELFSIVTGAHP